MTFLKKLIPWALTNLDPSLPSSETRRRVRKKIDALAARGNIDDSLTASDLDAIADWCLALSTIPEQRRSLPFSDWLTTDEIRQGALRTKFRKLGLPNSLNDMTLNTKRVVYTMLFDSAAVSLDRVSGALFDAMTDSLRTLEKVNLRMNQMLDTVDELTPLHLKSYAACMDSVTNLFRSIVLFTSAPPAACANAIGKPKVYKRNRADPIREGEESAEILVVETLENLRQALTKRLHAREEHSSHAQTPHEMHRQKFQNLGLGPFMDRLLELPDDELMLKLTRFRREADARRQKERQSRRRSVPPGKSGGTRQPRPASSGKRPRGRPKSPAPAESSGPVHPVP